jgi:hypothetical protein
MRLAERHRSASSGLNCGLFRVTKRKRSPATRNEITIGPEHGTESTSTDSAGFDPGRASSGQSYVATGE